MACPKIDGYELSDAGKKAITKAGKGKQLRYNNFQITTSDKEFGNESRDAFSMLFSPDERTVKEGAEILSRSLDGVEEDSKGRFDIRSKISSILTPKGSDRAILKIFTRNGDLDVDTLVDRTIAMQLMLDAIQSEADVQSNSDLTQEKLDELNATGTPTSLIRLAPVVGRALLNAKGIYPAGGNAKNLALYAKVGEKVLKDLEADGLTKIDNTATAKWISGEVVNPDGNKVSDGGFTQGTVIRVNEETFTEYGKDAIKNKSRIPKDHKDLLRVLKQLSRLTTTYRENPVLDEASDKLATDIAQTKTMQETLRKLQKGEFKVAPGVQVLLNRLHDLYLKSGENEQAFETALKSEFGVTDANTFVADAFGITPFDDSIFADSERGKIRSRVSPLVSLMQHYGKVDRDAGAFFVTYKQANNVRLFEQQDMLNFQSDKKMNRALIEASTPFDYEGDDAIDNLLVRTALEFGLPIDVIRGVDGKGKKVEGTADLEAILEWFSREDPEAEMHAFKQLANKKTITGLSGKSAWDKHKAIRAIAEIRAGYPTGKISTGVLLESDATASGPVLKLLQNIHQPKVKIILARMGLLPPPAGETVDSLGGALDDFYHLARESHENNQNNEFLTDEVALVEEIMDITGNKGDFRSFIKGPIVRFTYTQSDTNNKKSTSEALADDIIKEGYDAVNKALVALKVQTPWKGKAEEKNRKAWEPYTEALTKEEQYEMQRQLTKALNSTVSKYLVDNILDKTYHDGVFDGTKGDIASVFKAIARLQTLDIDNGVTFKFMNPDAVMAWLDKNPTKTVADFPYQEHAKYRVIGDKKKETLVGDGISDRLIQMWHPNPTSAQILPVHASDATILTRTVAAVYKAASTMPEFSHLSEEQISMMLVHDAIYMPPLLADVAEKAYEQEIINVSMNYDIVNMMLQELAFKQAQHNLQTKIAKGDTDAKFEKITLEELGEVTSDPVIKKIIARNADVIAEKHKLLDVNENDGKRKKGEAFKTIPQSFAMDTSDKARKKNEAEYNERIKGAPAKATSQAEAEADQEATRQYDEETQQEVYVDFNKSPDTAKADALAELLDSGDPYIVLDTEATGKKTEAEHTVGHQISYRVNNRSDGKRRSPVTTIDLPITEEQGEALTSDFIDFYLDVNDIKLEDASKGKEAVIKHINDKAAAQSKGYVKSKLKELNEAMNGGSLVAHNAPYDIAILKKIEGLDVGSLDVHDTRETAYVTKRDDIAAERQKRHDKDGTVLEVEFVGGITKQETLAAEFGIDTGDAHIAEDDVKTLEKLTEALVKEYKRNPVKVDAGYANVPGEMVYNLTTGEWDTTAAEEADTITEEEYNVLESKILGEMKDDKIVLFRTLEKKKRNDSKAYNAIMQVMIEAEKCKG